MLGAQLLIVLTRSATLTGWCLVGVLLLESAILNFRWEDLFIAHIISLCSANQSLRAVSIVEMPCCLLIHLINIYKWHLIRYNMSPMYIRNGITAKESEGQKLKLQTEA